MGLDLCVVVGNAACLPASLSNNPAASLMCGRSLRTLGAKPDERDLRFRTTAGFSYGLEGRIYSHDLQKLELEIERFLQAETCEECQDRVHRFVEQADGEFLVFAEDQRNGRSILFNDYVGRLPLFIRREAGCLAIGRSLQAILRVLPGGMTDKIGVAARLLFSYPLDDRTEIQGIESLPESCLIWTKDSTAAPLVSAMEVRYGAVPEAIKQRQLTIKQELIEDLGAKLVSACESRLSSCRADAHLVALSGGFDSRLVASAIHKCGGTFTALTRADYLSDRNDVRVARQVAEALGAKHVVVPCGPITPGLALRLAQRTGGALGAEMAHMLGFLLTAGSEIGQSGVLWTGDGGDKTVAPLLSDNTADLGAWVTRIVADVPRGELAASLELIGLSRTDIVEYADQSLRRQPGERIPEKLRALQFRQRARRWLNIGEDRNRTVFWSTTPFYSPDFLRTTNEIPDARKEADQLYRRLLTWLNPQCAKLPHSGRDRGRFSGRLLWAGYRGLSQSEFLLRVYRSMKPSAPVCSLDGGYNSLLSMAKAVGGGIWDLSEESRILHYLQHPPSTGFRSRLLSLALCTIQADSSALGFDNPDRSESSTEGRT